MNRSLRKTTGINIVIVYTSGTAQTNTNNISISDTTGGTGVQASVPALGSVTQMCIFHVDSNSDAVAKLLFLQSAKTSGGGTPKVAFRVYLFNRSNTTRYEVFRSTIDTQSNTIINLQEPIGFTIPANHVFYIVADTDTNGAEANCRFSLREYKRS